MSGPHAIAFTHDGALALVVDTNSEDVLAVDADARVEASLLRPLPGHMPEGIAIAPDDEHRVRRRAQHERRRGRVDHAQRRRCPARRRLADPAPRRGRSDAGRRFALGQHLFYSANSDELPITTNHWVACATCHIEGRSDAVTWQFAQGPRDTPSNAGGMLGTGFLFRTADRNQVQDYWHTINIEQGGTFDPTTQATVLDAIAAFVNHAIPAPIPADDRSRDGRRAARPSSSARRRLQHVPRRAALHRLRRRQHDARSRGLVMLHDVGTCVTAGYPDVEHDDIDGDARAACMFDTPSLVGVASSPPYLHDGSATTLRDVLEITRGKMGDITGLSSADLDNLVEYLRSL